jgi:hypothetical protein
MGANDARVQELSDLSRADQIWGPIGDHTSCATANDLPVCER